MMYFICAICFSLSDDHHSSSLLFSISSEKNFSDENEKKNKWEKKKYIKRKNICVCVCIYIYIYIYTGDNKQSFKKVFDKSKMLKC